MNPYKIGIIGLGAIGTRMLKGIEELYKGEIKVAAVCDANVALVQAVAKEFSVKHYFTNHTKLLHESDVDLIYIAVPPKYHEQVALDTIAAGKHILCEKPLANSLKEARSMVEAVKDTSIIHMMNFPLNYQPQMYKMMSLIEAGYIGNIERIDLVLHFPEWPRSWQKNSWVGNREQGGYILEVGAHWIQFIQKNFGQIDHIQGKVGYPDDENLCETSVTAKMKLSNGLNVHIDGVSQFEGQERVELVLHGTTGTLMLENWGTLKVGKVGGRFELISTEDMQIQSLLDHMILALKGHEAALFNFTVGYNVQVVLEAFKETNLSQGIDLSDRYLS
ncbi:Gfo/Idh/MocA family protein [Bacillus sp. DJP31]|uniref:Gfo/Idh/MocA family protein n=1 Tax=Bacillus sp. DJP31 TaxID=3409789 RepID=UPI003BB4A9A3